MTQTRSQAARSAQSNPPPDGHHAQPGQQQLNGGTQHSTTSRTLEEKENTFHKGVAISMWQNSGDENSNWTNFIKSSFPFAALPIGLNRFSGKYSVLQTCPDTWNRCVSAALAQTRAPLPSHRFNVHVHCVHIFKKYSIRTKVVPLGPVPPAATYMLQNILRKFFGVTTSPSGTKGH